MRLSARLLSAAIVLATATAAHADNIATFDINLTLVDGLTPTIAAGTVTGQVEIDTTNGQFTGADFSYVQISPATTYTFSKAPSDGIDPLNNQLSIFFDSDQSNLKVIGFQLPFSSLIGYTGGDVCSFANSECNTTVDVPSNTINLGNAEISQGSLTELQIITGTFNPFPDPNGGDGGDGSTTPTPEPSSLILLTTGLLGVATAARRRLTA